jgi:hypothetical protein
MNRREKNTIIFGGRSFLCQLDPGWLSDHHASLIVPNLISVTKKENKKNKEGNEKLFKVTPPKK